MRIISVNVGGISSVRYRGREVATGIVKRPVAGLQYVGRLGIAGDEQADRSVHGGDRKAVYVYAAEHYAHWRDRLGDLPHGSFGENLTVEGALEGAVCVGDLYRAGGALLQVTQPRLPCFKLALYLRQPMRFLREFLASGRSGFYLSVLEEGDVGAGDAFTLVARDARRPTVRDLVQSVDGARSAGTRR